MLSAIQKQFYTPVGYFCVLESKLNALMTFIWLRHMLQIQCWLYQHQHSVMWTSVVVNNITHFFRSQSSPTSCPDRKWAYGWELININVSDRKWAYAWELINIHVSDRKWAYGWELINIHVSDRKWAYACELINIHVSDRKCAYGWELVFPRVGNNPLCAITELTYFLSRY